MSYTNLIQDLRDKIQRDIMKEATIKNIIDGNESDGVLRLKNHIGFTIELYRPYEKNLFQEVRITGIDCESGEINCIDNDGNPIYLRYSDFLLEYLNCIYEVVCIKKDYQFVSNHHLSHS
jgi:hypothetical protein